MLQKSHPDAVQFLWLNTVWDSMANRFTYADGSAENTKPFLRGNVGWGKDNIYLNDVRCFMSFMYDFHVFFPAFEGALKDIFPFRLRR